ncbi:hypothetical protein LWI29_032060 [Acer saccharum]|uniref:E2 ubiquitin-conjugating enzyme n=1 Tax=Acer saccharum TaxID=4024 RepID=A0AA39SS27_ACESA|nr:hypothetical protein LWI29_032060 [Acer saccharum]
MAEKACVKRLQKEYRALCKEPVSHVVARPSPSNILEWHYVLEGSQGTPFAGGYYYGKIKFPAEYPYKPPGITMITPNGRFMTQKKICLSMSDFHPESWNPMWSVSSILTGLLSFMMDNSPTTGSVNTSAAEKQRLAKTSLAFNCKNPAFRKLFPEYVEKYNQQQLPEQQVSEQQSTESQKEENSGSKMEKLGNLGEDMKKAMIKKCPTYMDYEGSDYGVHEFDPQLDFSLFLEEARQHAKEVNFEASSTNTEELRKKKQIGGEKKIKKSWKNSLLSWWKVHKKSKSSMEPAASTSNISKLRKGHVSGPIYSSGRGDDIKLRRQTSGPITNLFNPIKRGECEIPYMCLDQINNSHHVKSYGPVYLVT